MGGSRGKSGLIHAHATCVAIGESGVLLIGEDGAGKSDLALRLIDRGASLIADDQVQMTVSRKTVIASAPENIKGLLEIRGIGIFQLKPKGNAPLVLVVRLEQRKWIERLPHPQPYECLGLEIPEIRIAPFEASAAIKIEMAVQALQNESLTIAGAFKE